MDIQPFPSYAAESEDEAEGQQLSENGENGWCLFSVEVRNTYGLPFDVSFERIQEGGWEFAIYNYL